MTRTIAISARKNRPPRPPDFFPVPAAACGTGPEGWDEEVPLPEPVSPAGGFRAAEPELRTTDMLFDEFASWDYSKSQNKAYHQNRHRLANLETALFKGTRLARIDASQCANFRYLAVPEGTLAPVRHADETAVAVTAADLFAEQDRFHLIQNMLFASSRQVNDMLGIKFNDDGSLYLVRPPSVHHKPLNS